MKIRFFVLLFLCGINTSFAEDVYSNRDWYRSYSIDVPECEKEVSKQIPDYDAGELNPKLDSKAGVIGTGIRAVFGLIEQAIGQASIQPKKNSAFAACMASKGWILIPEEEGEKLDKSRKAIIEQINLLGEESPCKNPELAEFYKKTPCSISEATPNNFSDKNFVSSKEIESVTKYKLIATQLNEKYIELYKQLDTTFSDELVNGFSSLSIGVSENASNLISKKVTWGEFNTQRKKLLDSYTNNWNEAHRKLKIATDSKKAAKDSKK